MESTRAIGSMVTYADDRPLLLAAIPIHLGVSIWWATVWRACSRRVGARSSAIFSES